MKSILSLSAIFAILFSFSFQANAQIMSTTDWSGNYVYSHFQDNAKYDLTITKNNGQYSAILQISADVRLKLDGRVTCEVKEGADKLAFKYVTHKTQSTKVPSPEPGTVLFYLIRKNGKVYTQWEGLVPTKLSAGATDTYFRKK